MVLYPEIQSIAQSELDHVVGAHRLPTFEDRDQLPYVSALLKEVLRWIPTLPLGTLGSVIIAIYPKRQSTNIGLEISTAVPHRAVKDDIYKGYHIPANASVIGNTWYVLVLFVYLLLLSDVSL